MSKSETLNEYVEPVLFAIQRDDMERMHGLIQRLRKRALEYESDDGEPTLATQAAFEAGVCLALLELVATGAHRSVFSNTADKVRSLEHGLVVLHMIGLFDQLGTRKKQSDLAHAFSHDQGNFSRLTNELQKFGVIRKESRGREKHCAITPSGEDVLDHLRPGWRAHAPTDDALLTTHEAIRKALNDGYAALAPPKDQGFEPLVHSMDWLSHSFHRQTTHGFQKRHPRKKNSRFARAIEKNSAFTAAPTSSEYTLGNANTNAIRALKSNRTPEEACTA